MNVLVFLAVVFTLTALLEIIHYEPGNTRGAWALVILTLAAATFWALVTG